MLISPEYLELNQQMHFQYPEWGNSSWQYAGVVTALCALYETRDVLDYGCGIGRLQDELKFTIQQYDPAMPQRAARPVPADIIFCGDVMEHIEPDCLDAVLDHIARLTKRAAFITVTTVPASFHSHTLSDVDFER